MDKIRLSWQIPIKKGEVFIKIGLLKTISKNFFLIIFKFFSNADTATSLDAKKKELIRIFCIFKTNAIVQTSGILKSKISIFNRNISILPIANSDSKR